MGYLQTTAAQAPHDDLSSIVPMNRSPLTPSLAAAAKRFGIQSDVVDRHEAHTARQSHLDDVKRLKQDRDASRTQYDALKQTVDQLVSMLQDVARDPNEANGKEIQNIRFALMQALTAMERQQVELKGIRARTQRLERAVLKTEELHTTVKSLNSEISGYQTALHGIRGDMVDLVELVEGDGGLKELANQLDDVRYEVKDTQNRTSRLEDKSAAQTARLHQLETEVQQLRRMMTSSMQETTGVAGSVVTLRQEVTQLHKRIGHYIIDQMRIARRG